MDNLLLGKKAMRDLIFSCVQCDGTFVFSVAEQKRLDALGFDAPTRCRNAGKGSNGH